MPRINDPGHFFNWNLDFEIMSWFSTPLELTFFQDRCGGDFASYKVMSVRAEPRTVKRI